VDISVASETFVLNVYVITLHLMTLFTVKTAA